MFVSKRTLANSRLNCVHSKLILSLIIISAVGWLDDFSVVPVNSSDMRNRRAIVQFGLLHLNIHMQRNESYKINDK